MHEAGLIHQDIKASNLLIDEQGVIKITDPALFKILAMKLETNVMPGSEHYMAPEIYKNEEVSKAVDIWALGMTIIEMVTGFKPFFDVKK